jgi:AraC-like DNA-binding protein
MGSVIFGEFWAGYIGRAHPHTPHEHIATQVAVGLDGPVSILSGNELVCSEGVTISPRVEHVAQASAGERVVFLYIAPHVALSRALENRLGGSGVARMDSRLVDCFRQGGEVGDMVHALCRELGTSDDRASFDRRLMRALDVLQEDVGTLGAIERATAASGMSEARLRALARAEMGIPLSQWMTWRKLDRSVRLLAEGLSMSCAALEAGFSDQAHFARTVRRMFGITPTEVLPSLKKTSGSFKTMGHEASMMSTR